LGRGARATAEWLGWPAIVAQLEGILLEVICGDGAD
jgi:hypothetical protein